MKNLEDEKFFGGNIKKTNLVNVKIFVNSDCVECTKLDEYLEVYKESGVKFGNISRKEYLGQEYKSDFNNYVIKKLPFIVFSKQLGSYQTLSNSWDDTFGYKNNLGEFIPTDIIPPYFDLKTKEIKGLIDIVYIGDNNCKDCYKIDDSIKIFRKFGLRFNNIKELDIKEEEAFSLIEKYKIDKFPIVILSVDTKLYKNFSYFWKSIGTIEDDGSYVLKEPGKLGLKISHSN